jgi:hypothetical protein
MRVLRLIENLTLPGTSRRGLPHRIHARRRLAPEAQRIMIARQADQLLVSARPEVVVSPAATSTAYHSTPASSRPRRKLSTPKE